MSALLDSSSIASVPRYFVGALKPGSLPSTDFRRLPRCRVGGGALGYPHAGLRPPRKRSVQFSRTPLSQRHATSVGGSKELVRSSVPAPTHRTDDVPAAVSSPDTATA